MAGTLDTRAKFIFGEALDLSGHEREELLESACDGDGQLRERVVALLSAAEREDRFLSAPAGGELDAAPPPGERPGDTLGPYRLEEQLGEGGFGTVFLARQERPVRRAVALKIIKLGMDTRAVIARFEQERQALALMDHPNIARVIDAGATGTGRPYFVMDLVRGEPITAYAQRRKLPVRARLGLFLQVCEAIQHAHTKGVIHRDIKPSNILVTDGSGAGEEPDAGAAGGADNPERALVRVIDFGIAKATSQTLTERSLQTAAQQPMGTPAYMSPEQAEGSPDIDTRADVYSLGAVLYELLTGQTPFDAQTLRSASFATLHRLIRDTDPPTPSARAGRGAEGGPAPDPRLAASLRGDLDWITMRALEKDRARRYDSPARLADDLRRFLEGKTVSAAPPSRAYRFRKFVGRHRVAVGATALVSVALLGGTSGTTIGLFRARAARADALKQADIAQQNARVAESVNTLLTTTIERAKRNREKGRADITVREVMDAAAKELTQRPGVHEPRVELALASAIGDTYKELSLHEPAEAMRRLAVQRAVQVSGEGSVEHAEALGRLAATLRSRANHDESRELYARAREILVGAGPAGAERLAVLSVDESLLDADAGRFDKAERELNEAIAWFEAGGRTSTIEYFAALHNLAGIYYGRGEAARAVPILRRNTELQRVAFGADDDRTLESLHALSVVQLATGDPDVETTLREEIAAERRLRGNEHESLIELLNTLSVSLANCNRLVESEAAIRESMELARRVWGPGHPTTLVRTAAHAGTLMRIDRDAEAESELREVLPMLRRPTSGGDDRVGPGGPDTVLAAYNLGLVLQRRGAPGEAEAVLRPIVEDADARLKDGHRYEWLRRVASSLLGAVIADQAASAGTSPRREQALARISEAENLVVAAAERLLVIAPKIGPRNRAVMVPAALDRAVRLYTLANQLDPDPEYAKALAEWEGRRKQFAAANPAPSPPARQN